MSAGDGFFARWSRRKHDATAGRPLDEQAVAPAAPAQPAAAAPASAPVEAPPPAPLPPVQSLTFESDFTAFMGKGVDPELQRTALRTLFNDERFNVMDGLDVYIDDYTKTTPIPPEWYERMAQLAGLGDVHAREAAAAEQAATGAPGEAAAQTPASVGAAGHSAASAASPEPRSTSAQLDESVAQPGAPANPRPQ